MKIINIDEQVLEQMNRQIDFAYFLAASVIAIALLVVGYQLTINHKTINSIKEENSKILKKTLRPLVMNQLATLSILETEDEFARTKELLELILTQFKDDKELFKVAKDRYENIRSGHVHMFYEIGQEQKSFHKHLNDSMKQNVQVSVEDLAEMLNEAARGMTGGIFEMQRNYINKIKQLDKIFEQFI